MGVNLSRFAGRERSAAELESAGEIPSEGSAFPVWHRHSCLCSRSVEHKPPSPAEARVFVAQALLPVLRELWHSPLLFRWKSGPLGPRKVSTLYPVFPTEREGANATEREWRNPENASSTTPSQGVLTIIMWHGRRPGCEKTEIHGAQAPGSSERCFCAFWVESPSPA